MVSWAALVFPLSVALSTLASADDIDKQFERFVDEFKREYDVLEKEVRREVFRSNIRYIEEENAKGHSYVLGVTEFADMTADEFALTHFGLANSKPWGNLQSLGTHVPRNTTLPASVDWRSTGAVTPIKNQASCGSCWAFSTTGSLEGAWKIATGKLVSLSEQQLVDCSKSFGNEGCNGGLMDNGFKYTEQTNLCTESSYPYLARNSICKASSCASGIPKGSVTGYKDVKADDTNALMDAVAQQPVSIAIEADRTVFQLYKGGVLSGDCGSNLDHGVLAVGYGSENGKDYWVVKNSWGSSWGMEGYALLLRGKKGAGECGIKSQASYPVVTGTPGPSPGPSPPPPPSPSSSHYEKPPCQDDETEASVQGAGGEVCAPSCDTGSCPTDTPPGTRAKPQCILQDASTGKKYCALACLFPGSCPKGSKCARIGGIQGVCVWPASAKSHPTKTLELKSPHSEISI